MHRNEFIKKKKDKIRNQIWDSLMKQKIARFPLPCYGKVPNFNMAINTAKLLSQIKEFKEANWVLVSPDSPQRPIRELVLKSQKKLIMASPKLKSGYLLIDAPPQLIKKASTISSAFKFSKNIGIPDNIDIAIIGSVAVDHFGNRLGKGGGYGDQEIKLARKYNATIITNIHSIQLIPNVPINDWDQKVDIIITEKEVIRINNMSK
ncbi:MAG: 5-formyltetrahydrofolate cyclo-ligase [Candidatus Helarchaeota archaeon]